MQDDPGTGLGGEGKRGAPFTSALVWIGVAALFGLSLWAASTMNGQQTVRVQLSFTAFKQQVERGNVSSVTARGSEIDGGLHRPVVDSFDPSKSSTDFFVIVPQFAGGELEPLLEAHHVTVTAQSTDNGSLDTVLLAATVPAILLLVGGVWLLARQRSRPPRTSGLFGMRESKARIYDGQSPRITFADVAGVDEVRDELQQVVEFLRRPGRYRRLGGTVPKGVLLVGPPGTGKTLLARAVAGEAGVRFYSVAASEFVEMIVGVGAARVRDLFNKARSAAPAIVFIDELDAVGRRRGSAASLDGHNEQEQTLNQILIEMDGFDPRLGVVVLAATNRADVLDPALLRPGRFDRQVIVQPPDRPGRAAILAIHTQHVPMDPSVDLDELAAQTPGLVGADLRNLVNEAALLAARRDRPAVVMADFEDALQKVLLGRERHIALSQADRERIAYHEAGHALVALLTPGSDPVRLVSIVPRGSALGVTLQSPMDDRLNYPEDYLRARITSALGGRAAEQLVYGVVTTGAENDLQQVTAIARDMVERWGMGREVGLLHLAQDAGGVAGLQGGRRLSEETARRIDREIAGIVSEAYTRARTLLRDHRRQLEALAAALLEQESLDGATVRDVTGVGQMTDARDSQRSPSEDGDRDSNQVADAGVVPQLR